MVIAAEVVIVLALLTALVLAFWDDAARLWRHWRRL